MSASTCIRFQLFIAIAIVCVCVLQHYLLTLFLHYNAALASVMIPGAAINMIVKSSRLVLSRATFLPTIAAGWGPTGIGLASIPFIIHPIDNAVDQLMDNTVREWLKEEGESGGSSGSSGREEYVKK